MTRVYNFSAGPAMLPEEVLTSVQEELLDYQGSGMSVMEMSHRTELFEGILHQAEKDLRQLMGIPDGYRILFLQGGASLQFAMIPMNLMRHQEADFILTGQWSTKAFQEAEKYGKAKVIASSKEQNFSCIPNCRDLPVSEHADYVYICENNTIYGTKFQELPDTKGKPLVADVSSCILSEPCNVSDYGLLFAGTQKNIGPAGMAVVIIREDLIPDEVPENVPTMMTYKTHVDADSMYNTPNCWCIYFCGKVFRYLLDNGGLPAMRERNEKKAAVLYDFLDQSSLFSGTVKKEDRSLMNVTFVTGDEALDKKFIKEAEENGFVNLKGHRSVGGMRASIYNAMPIEGVEKLAAFMSDFERKNS